MIWTFFVLDMDGTYDNEELCKRFPEDISKRIISSIKEKPLIWNLLNPKAITY